MPLVVGEAEVVIRANTTGLDAELAASGDAGYASMSAKADTAGEDIGSGLSSGLGRGAKDIGKDTEKDLEQSTGRMKGLVNDFSSKASSSLQSIGVPASLLKGTSLAAIGIAGVGVAVLDLGSKMQKANATIAASSGESIAAVTKIGDAFLTTAGSSQHSAIDMSNAFGLVAGQLKTTEGHALTAAQALDFMKTASDLATASGTDLGMTTQTLAGIMQAFQLNATQAAGAANVLFNASNATGQGMDTLANSMEKLRAKLGATAPPLSALATLTVDMTKQGITGRAAVTGLNGAVTALAAAASGSSTSGLKAEAALKALGVSAKQANGELTPMSTIIDALGPKFKTMTESQQIATATLIFGSSAAKSMTAVILAGNTAYDSATATVNKHNAVQLAASKMTHTLSGEMEVLKSTIIDEGVKLGTVLVPALTDVVHAIVPVVTGVVDLVDWFAKGGTAARVIEGVLVTVLAPALIKMGVDAATSATKAVVSFVTMSGAAKTNAEQIVASDTTIVDANATAAGSFAEMSSAAAAAIPGIGATMAGMTGEVEAGDAAIVTANEEAGASFTALLGPIGIAAGAVLLFHNQISGVLTDVANKTGLTAAGQFIGSHLPGSVHSSKQEQQGYDKQLASVKSQSQLDSLNKGFAELSSLSGFPMKLVTSMKELNDTISKSPAGKIVGVKGVSPETAEQRATKQSQDAYDAILKELGTSTKKSGSSSSTKASDAAKKVAAAAAKAESTLTSEVVHAIGLPANEAKRSLELLGVPATKAAKVLADAAEPFARAVKALEQQGFDAADAVKIAEAGSAEVRKEAKAAAAAALTASKKTTSTSDNTAGVLINGIEVAGAVYDAAVGAAFNSQTGASPTGITGDAKTTPPAWASVGAPAMPPSIQISAGAIVINPASGNDSKSLLATHGMIEEMLGRLIAQLQSGVNSLGTRTA